MTLVRPAAWAAVLVAAVPAAADPPAEQPRPRVVFRVSRGFIQSLTRDGVEQVHPVATSQNGATISGSARVSAGYTVTLRQSATETAFDIRVAGFVDTDLGVTRRPVRVRLDGYSPITAERRVSYDGEAYAGGPVSVGADYSTELGGIEPLRRGPLAPVVRRLARPRVLRALPAADRAATERVHAKVREAVTEDTDEVIAKLNALHDVRVGVMELLRARGVAVGTGRPALTATEDALLAGFGFPPGEAPVLPAVADAPSPVELWVKHERTPEQARTAKLSRADARAAWEKFVKPVLVKQVSQRSPDLARRLEGATHDVDHEIAGAPGWHRVRFFQELREAEAPAQ